ncbi:hypothetical protein [Lactobacillus delbrueckii]|uniref:hypothetical protein n=1 Tax=Lactobacillus delbrueckii TaxID=1584 RepID=UPI000731E6C1|nr:hypothetical protein [Lactobacillus delbrueckii]ALT46975.1 hypothetical protein AT236_00559 [Lactobacillus delbrueckii subsp. bulgaricus]MCD5462962.1 hypothetical protein [Lactobacillus delbrueckii subsp. bulgaricus]MCD5514053.1 hypothetical protein [Lactobacillus delbrueckii subsp. lactis]MCT3501709.1 hypothetical protein [Lactobacillus delbrueckii subsp. lactis]
MTTKEEIKLEEQYSEKYKTLQNLVAMVEDQYSGSFIITPAGEQIPEPHGWTLVEISKLALEMYGLTTALDQDNKTALYIDC